jgi:glucose/arabinose dehydrogenase
MRFAALCALALCLPGLARAQTVPAHFDDVLVAKGLEFPTNMAFLPDGRLLVTEQGTGRIRVVIAGEGQMLQPGNAGMVDSLRTGGVEAGLVGIAVDPGWPARPYVYVQATRANPDRVVIWRYTMSGVLTSATSTALALVPSSRYTILSVPDVTPIHHGGTLLFGLDGMLYAGIGDDDLPCTAQDLRSPNGKLFRLDVDGLPLGAGGPPRYTQITPIDNPFLLHPDSTARLVYAYGLRNPFGFHLDPANGGLIIGDVGSQTYEEIDLAPQPGGQNFGWPLKEANLRIGIACTSPDTMNLVPPIYSYAHGPEGAAIIGGPIYRAPANAAYRFDPSYQGTIFLGDTWLSLVRNLVPSGPNWAVSSVPGQPNPTDWAINTRWITHLEVGPDGGLWYTMLYRDQPANGPGEVRRVLYYPPTTGVDTQKTGLALASPRPSPARGEATIAWTLPLPARVAVTLHDANGRTVRRLLPAGTLQPAGSATAHWDGRDDAGRTAPAGVYFVRLRAGLEERSTRLVLLR